MKKEKKYPYQILKGKNLFCFFIQKMTPQVVLKKPVIYETTIASSRNLVSKY
ncbi:UNVERIFIED_CONTAM: hypothetical protein GTU68_057295 [Idotea baltica]|nr:hypothetical protein [Idotea baltica]